MKAALSLCTGWTQVFQELTGSSADDSRVMYAHGFIVGVMQQRRRRSGRRLSVVV